MLTVKEHSEWWFSVLDIIGVLNESLFSATQIARLKNTSSLHKCKLAYSRMCCSRT